ncbi:MAG: DNA alkylation repair protein [Chitinophagaceae bacterium]|nr:DNA alkylation repair protein [Chitinophagaceae bacterium]
MNSKELIEEIRSYCLANANEANVIKYSRYFKGGFNANGLANGQVESKVNELLQDKAITIPLILQAAPELVKSEKYEETGFALLMLNHRKKQYSHEVFQAIESWFAFGIRNWAHADMLGMWILPDHPVCHRKNDQRRKIEIPQRKVILHLAHNQALTSNL